jgi:hypothetical protein
MFKYQKVIGQGAFGVVLKVEKIARHQNRTHAAIKVSSQFIIPVIGHQQEGAI